MHINEYMYVVYTLYICQTKIQQEFNHNHFSGQRWTALVGMIEKYEH